jgi:hypothetical protein
MHKSRTLAVPWCGSTVRNLVHVNLPARRMLRMLFENLCTAAPLPSQPVHLGSLGAMTITSNCHCYPQSPIATIITSTLHKRTVPGNFPGLLDPEDKDATTLQHIGNSLPNYTVKQLKDFNFQFSLFCSGTLAEYHFGIMKDT